MSRSNGRLAATSREPEEWARATEAARDVRAVVAQQVAELILSGDKMGGRGGLTMRVRKILEAEGRIAAAKAGRQSARLSGLSEAPAMRAIEEGRDALRAAVMEVAVEAGQWVAALDFEGVPIEP